MLKGPEGIDAAANADAALFMTGSVCWRSKPKENDEPTKEHVHMI
jgi:hypothetical protein